VTLEHRGKLHRLAVVRTAQGVWVGWRGGSRFFGQERQEGSGRGPDHGEIRAPMTGRIALVRVAPGDAVKEKDVVVVLEAMKMEYQLAAPRAGTVEAVLCRPGDLVDLGAPLVRLKEEAGPGEAAT